MRQALIVLLVAAMGSVSGACGGRPAALPAAAAGSPQPPDALSRQQAIQVMRGVIDLEVWNHGRDSSGFHNLADLLRFQADRSDHTILADLPLKPVDATSVSIFDYTLTASRSEDGKHFQSSLLPTAPKDCAAPAWFIDDGAVIYTGHPIC